MKHYEQPDHPPGLIFPYDILKEQKARIVTLEAELAEQVGANTELVRRDMQSCNGLNVANRRIRELEAALQLRCPQCDMRLIERTALEREVPK